MVRVRSSVKAQPGLLLQPFVVAQLGGRIVERVVEGSEITAAEYAVTSWLNVRVTATPTALAAELGMAPTTLSAIVDRLVRKKQIRRTPHPDDGRSYILQLTSRGKATNARNGQRLGEALRTLNANLEGSEEVLASLRRLEQALRQTLAEP